MLKTQFFHRFLEDRQENPDEPEVKFFDQSINAKINRSKKRSLTLGRPGQKRKDTSFLHDTSGKISETYAPPPPSNWGLPDDGRSYSYGRFPPLNPDLFGKIRTPRKWARNRRTSLRMTRRVSVAMQRGERAVFTRAKAPLARQGSNLIAATKRGARTLEHAISALSSPFANLKDPGEVSARRGAERLSNGTNRVSVASGVTVPSELGLSMENGISAEEVVLNARRKQAILLGIIISFQRLYRMRNGGVAPARQFGGVLCEQFDQISREVREWGAASNIQTCYRVYRMRSSIRRIRLAAARLQALARSHRARYAYGLVRQAVLMSQARCRGFIARRRLSTLIKGSLLRFRNHICLLWMKSNTSLCYRTKLWALIRKNGVLPFVLAEEEILRLWIECQVQPPAGTQNGENEDDDYVLLTGRRLGVSTRTYYRLRKVSEYAWLLGTMSLRINPHVITLSISIVALDRGRQNVFVRRSRSRERYSRSRVCRTDSDIRAASDSRSRRRF